MEILELHLLTADIQKTELFYNTVLACDTISKTDKRLTLQAGNSHLIFHSVKNEKPVYHFAFTIHSEKLLPAFELVSEKASMIPGSDGENIIDFAAWQAKAFYFFDNNGNIVEFISRRPVDEYIQPSNSFIHSISEAGLVVNDVTKFANELHKKYNLEFFNRQPRHTDSFSVVGDDLGLLILVPPQRNWYPTNIASGEFGTKVKIRIKGAEFFIEV